MNRRASYTFNSLVTGVKPDTGRFDEDAHRKAVLPMRGYLLQTDGIVDCHINRTGISVEYVQEVIGDEAVDAAVDGLIEWAIARTPLFPMRGTKLIVAVRNPSTARREKVVVLFKTHLTVFPASPGSTRLGWDEELHQRMLHDLIVAMTNTDGIVGYSHGPRSASVIYDMVVTDRDTVTEHLRAVFLAAAEDKRFFPYLGGAELTMQFSYSDV